MYRLLIISTDEVTAVAALDEQVGYLRQFQIDVKILLDPTEMELIREISETKYNCAYVHIKRRFSKEGMPVSYDPTKILEYYEVPFMGNHFVTQVLIADKFLTGKKSGIGIPNIIVTRNMRNKSKIDYESIANTLMFPLIVKPNSLHASKGISTSGVVFSVNELEQRVNELFDRFENLADILIEKYLQTGIEYTVSVLGNSDGFVCSISRLDYRHTEGIHVNTEADKLASIDERSFDFNIETNQDIRSRLEYHAKTLFKHFNMKDFARFDMILDNTYYLIEANTSPIPGNSFSWEWQIKYGIGKKQVVALFLCAFHFGRIASGKPDCLPIELIAAQPEKIIREISCPCAVDTCPECSGPTGNCDRPELFSMNDRVSSETEVHSFLVALVELLKPAFILETGTFKGSGTIALAEGLRKNQFGKMTSIEIDKDLAEKAKNEFVLYPVEILHMNSLSYTPTEGIDLLFLDSKRSIRKEEFLRFRKFLHSKSVIVWHDSSPRPQSSDVFEAVNEFYDAGIIDRILLPTPRGLTLSMLRNK